MSRPATLGQLRESGWQSVPVKEEVRRNVAARIAAGMGANVVIMDINLDRLRYLDEIMPANVRTAYQKQFSLGERTLLDLLDSENELFSASRRLAEIKNVQLFSQYRIKATMGQLLKSQGVVAPLASVVQNDVKPKVQLPGMN